MSKEIIVFICDILVATAIGKSFFFFDALDEYVDAIIMLNSKQCPISNSMKEKITSIIKKAGIWLVAALSATLIRSGVR